MEPVSRRQFLCTAAVPAVGLGLSGLLRAAAEGGRRPNLLFIMSDDHAAHAIGAYGSRVNRTPQIDRLASGGMRFGNCFCTNSICGPSRAVILTGRYSHLNGFIDNSSRFDGSQVTFPKLLQAAGYQTAIVGKWHLVSDPTGFDYWCVLPGQGAYVNPVFIDNGTRRTVQGYVSDITTDLALGWLDQHDPTRPFCLLLQHKAPHRNWIPAERFAKLYEDEAIVAPDTLYDDYGTRSAAARTAEMRIDTHLTPQDLKQPPPAGLAGKALTEWKYQRYIKDYLRCVASVDESVGRVLDWLDANGLAGNTLVVYTSDQGFYLGDHGWFDKRFMYEESLRMPLLVRYPPLIPAGTVNRDLVLNLDFAPTFLDLAGAAVPAEMQGRSLLPVLGGQTPADWRTAMYYHYYEYPGVHAVKRHYGIRTQRYKLIHFYYDIDAWELYDLETDPEELRNRYDDPACAGVVRELRAQVEQLRARYGDSDEVAVRFLPKPKAAKGK